MLSKFVRRGSHAKESSQIRKSHQASLDNADVTQGKAIDHAKNQFHNEKLTLVILSTAITPINLPCLLRLVELVPPEVHMP